MLELSVLGSGSQGNATLLSDGEFTLLIDAGFTGQELTRRLGVIGRTTPEIQAILITHDHSDHINGAGVIGRNANAPIYIHETLYPKLRRRLGKKLTFNFMEPDKSFTLGSMTITPFEVPHDSIHCYGFTVQQGDLKLGYATDVGSVTPSNIEALKRCHTLIIESNHEEELLLNGPYPQRLKDRVYGDMGHISNDEAGEILKAVAHDGLKRVIFIHLSEENNRKELVLDNAEYALEGYSPELVISSQYTPTKIFRME